MTEVTLNNKDKKDKTEVREEVDENTLIAQRRQKLADWREDGAPFPNDFRPTHRAHDLHERYGEREADDFASDEIAQAGGRCSIVAPAGAIA